jgi:uncharacterized membrane protein
MKPLTWADAKIEKILGTLLQVGVLLSGAVVFVGGILYIIHYGHQPASYHAFVGTRAGLSSFSSVLAGALHGDARAIIQLGLLLLIATPVARVVFSIAGFWLERDRTYVIFTCVVLAILLFGLFAGR